MPKAACIALQILHAGRYAAHLNAVGPSPIQAPISPLTPRELTTDEVEQTIADFARCATLAQSAGYDGVEIMGSEGYLINQFLVTRTNARTDKWGGEYAARMRFAVEIVRARPGGRRDPTSSSSTASRCSTWSTRGRPSTRSSSWPRPSRRRARR
ncbi:MAG: hypothetical protein V9F04_07805 [Dermatophilaceae bacterium]